MRKNDTAAEKEAGWEFTLPNYVVNPFNWLIVILILIAIILSFVLVTKVTNTQSLNQTVTTQSQ